jgi:ribosome recycling factor
MKPGSHNPAPAGAFQSVKDVDSAARTRMDKVVSDLQHEMTGIRTGRASVNLLQDVQVDAYGGLMPINHVATLHVPEPSMITVQPYDVSQIAAIEKAIRSADLGLNPSNDGKLIRVPIPALTEERRKELVKRLHHVVEDHRVAARNIRRDSNEHLKKLLKDKLISEDDERRGLDETQKLTDSTISKLDQIAKAREAEIMKV